MHVPYITRPMDERAQHCSSLGQHPSLPPVCHQSATCCHLSATCLPVRPVLLLSVSLVVCLHVAGWNGQQDPSHVVLGKRTAGGLFGPSYSFLNLCTQTPQTLRTCLFRYFLIFLENSFFGFNSGLHSGSCFVASKPRSTILSAWNVTCFENNHTHIR